MSYRHTRIAFIWSYLLNTPFWAIFSLLPFILYSDLGASAWQITIVIALKPMVALFSLYWGAAVKNRRDRLKSNIIWGTLIGHIPFFFFPWVRDPWFFVGAFGLYMLLLRGTIPAWMEVLKLNVPSEPRHALFARVSTWCYLGNAIFPLFFGWFLDRYQNAWQWIFPLTALVSLSAILLQRKILIPEEEEKEEEKEESISLKEQLVSPWVMVWDLLKSRSDFLRYQVGFMLSGFGLMVIQPALPVFFVDGLHMSYTEIGFALTVCKGIGFAAAAHRWAKWLNRVNIYRFLGLVTAIAALFPLAVLAAKAELLWIYAAYILYGVMQAGSEMGWKLSGPLFAQEQDSSPYSSVNVVTVGLRGCIAPFVGSFLLLNGGVTWAMLMGFALCSLASLYMLFCSRRVAIFQKAR